MKTLEVVEKFVSINGEGTKAGQLAVFIRFKGCCLACGYCDTKWANKADVTAEKMTSEEILSYVLETGIKNVTLTGGEPLFQDGIEEVIALLAKHKRCVEIETSGACSLRPVCELQKENVTFTMDYKLPGSGMEKYMDLDNFQMLTEKDTVKFVVSDQKDLLRAKEIINRFSLTRKCHVYISPVFGKIALEEMVSFMKENRLNDVTMQIQMHKIIWAPDQRGV